jgi:hypothetical protein
LSRYTIALLAVVWIPSCRNHDVAVEFYSANGYQFSQSERQAIETVANATSTEVRRFLPALPHHLVLRVQPAARVIPETGETGYAVLPNSVGWMVDPNHFGGASATIQRELRATLFHEFHHLVRYAALGEPESLLGEVIGEGMATVFERDAAGTSPPWGMYPKDVMNWVTELSALPPNADRSYWMTKSHADGRRWVGMRAGTYLVDQAMRASGRSSAQLVSTPDDAVIRMALGR